MNRSNQRAQRLQDAMRAMRGNAALLEELLAWLTEAQALLTAKEKDLIPEDLHVVEDLVKEHLVCLSTKIMQIILKSVSGNLRVS